MGDVERCDEPHLTPIWRDRSLSKNSEGLKYLYIIYILGKAALFK